MVDNFELIQHFLKDRELSIVDGDCWYVQLLRRATDDPMLNGVQDKKYHGNMYSRSVKDYLIKNAEHLGDLKEEITCLCGMFNVRAYIRLNKRNYKNIAMHLLTHIAEQCANGGPYSSPFRLLASACGKSRQSSDGTLWLIDLDKEYFPYENEIRDMVLDCQPYDKIVSDVALNNGLDVTDARETVKRGFFVVPTKNGKHIHCRPFNMAKFSQIWSKFSTLHGNIKQIDIHKDNPTILYVP